MKRPDSGARRRKTSWENVAGWYQNYMGSEGGDFQREIVFPGALRLLDPKAGGHYLDIACGQGAFAKLIAQKTHGQVVGIDASATLIEAAKRKAPATCRFLVSDAANFGGKFDRESFHGAACLLAIQNIDRIEPVFAQAVATLKPGAPFVIVMNHPCFRQPRQSGWGWDEERKLQYRRVDRYMTTYEMPILAHPGSAPQVKTYSYHRPLTDYVAALAKSGFAIDALEEWVSNKKSDSGPRAKAENVAREEIPMFLAIRARKY